MPTLFKNPTVQQIQEPPDLAAETTKIEADKKRQTLKDTRRVQTILTGSGGVVEETQKALDGQGVLLGSGKPLRKS